MMINRLKGYLDGPGRSADPDYWIVAHRSLDFVVTREAAESVLRALNAGTKPRWIRFRDIHGSEVSVRSTMVEYVVEYTFEQRASIRRFRRARKQEDEEDRPAWEDDDGAGARS